MRDPTRQGLSRGRQRSLEAQNRRLTARLAAVTDELGRRERLLRMTQQRELELLRATSLAQLLDRMIHGLKASYQLDAVRLILEDPEHEIRHLLESDGVAVEQLDGLLLVDSLRELVPHLRALDGPWVGPYCPQEHERLVSPPGADGSLVLIPLAAREGQLEGLLVLCSADLTRFSADLGGDALTHLGVVAAICTENAVNRARLVCRGLKDFLTGFYNRRYLHARLREELARAQRLRQSLACLMIDIDHFKRINDRYGHLAGDAVLRELARRIQREMRLSDTGVRFGGDEIAIVLAQGTLEDGARVAERVRHAVCSEPITVSREVTLTVTVSIGVAAACPRASVRDDQQLAERLIAAADAALYRAKSAGRNRVELSPGLIS